jgi:glycosyltransferase involved in cell wall biosynthesis
LQFDNINTFIIYGHNIIDFKVINAIKDIIKSFDIRIIHSNEYKSNLVAIILKFTFNLNLRIVTTVHGFISNSLKSKFYIVLDKCIIPLFDKIITVSSPQSDFFERSKYKIELINNFINPDYWINGNVRENTDNTTIGYSGRISKEKGWADFVEVAKVVIETDKSISFLIAGDGNDRLEMESLVLKYGINNHFTFLGVVEDMRDFYKRIDILLAPSYTEGLPVAQLEANAMSLPVVATNVGGVRDLIIHNVNGFLTEKGNIQLLATYILMLAGDSELRSKLGENGRKRILSNFSTGKQIKKIEKVYLEFC